MRKARLSCKLSCDNNDVPRLRSGQARTLLLGTNSLQLVSKGFDPEGRAASSLSLEARSHARSDLLDDVVIPCKTGTQAHAETCRLRDSSVFANASGRHYQH